MSTEFMTSFFFFFLIYIYFLMFKGASNCICNSCNAVILMPTKDEILNIPQFEMIFFRQKIQNGVQLLQDCDRVKLANIVIKYVLYQKPRYIFTNQDFENVSKSIVMLFPLETVDTYYGKYKGRCRDGKLVNAYKNCRQHLLAAGIVPAERQASSATNGKIFKKGILQIFKFIS
jgi:hypothetical protein